MTFWLLGGLSLSGSIIGYLDHNSYVAGLALLMALWNFPLEFHVYRHPR